MARPSKILTKEDIIRSQKVTRSNMSAARYLHVSYNHYKKYAKMYKNDEGISLLEAHMNQSGEGIPKYTSTNDKDIPLEDLLSGRVPIDHLDPRKVKARLLSEAKLVEVCNNCNFSEKRVTDLKVPVLLNFKDGNKKNWNLSNLEFLCYNCSFLYAVSPITDNEAEAMESYVKSKDQEPDWELEDWQLDHLKDLGLEQDEKPPGEEYISRI